jgi:hypothetical protein
MLRTARAEDLTERLFRAVLGHLTSRGLVESFLAPLRENPAFQEAQKQALVRAVRLQIGVWQSGVYPLDITTSVLILRSLAEQGCAVPLNSIADWCLGDADRGESRLNRPYLAGLLLGFPGLDADIEMELLDRLERVLDDMLDDLGEEMEETADDPLYRLVQHPDAKLSSLEMVAACPAAGLAHDVQLSSARTWEHPEIVEALIPHTDAHRLGVIVRRAPAEPAKKALLRLANLSPAHAAAALAQLPAEVSLTQGEQLPLLLSDHAELRLQALLRLPQGPASTAQGQEFAARPAHRPTPD